MPRGVETRHEVLLDSLWPASARSSRSPSPLIGDYVAFPEAVAPRFLLPHDRRAAVAVLTHFRSDGDAALRRRILALRAVVRTTGGSPFGHRVRVGGAGAGDTIEAHLRDVLGVDFFLGIHLGPPRANRKPILQILDADRVPLAFGKLGVDPLTRSLVRAEGEALRTLDGHDLPGVRVPRVMHAGRWGEQELLLTEVLPLRDATRPVPDEQRVRAMVTIARALGTRSLPPAGSAWLTRHRVQASGLSDPVLAARLLAVLDVLAASDDAWDIGCWHGDWNAWNSAAHGDDVLVWDWERFDPAVPLGWDALHHALRADLERRGPVPGPAARLLGSAPELLEPFDVPPSRARLVAVAYLVELALRYAGDDQRGAGGRAARIEDWLLPVLPS